MVARANAAFTPFWGMSRAQQIMLMALGAAAFGGIVYGISTKIGGRRRGLLPAGPPECDIVGPTGGRVAGIRYLERVTPGADPESALPMIVLFHAKGSRPEHYTAAFRNISTPARIVIPEGVLELGVNREWFRLPARTKKQAELAEQMAEAGAPVAKFLADIVRCRPTVGRPVITGSSQGGSVTYLIATLYPYLVRGAVALAGWLPAQLWAPHLPPTVGMHGTQDTTVPFEATAEYAAAMQAQGANFEFLTYPTGHGISAAMQSDWASAVKALLG